MGSNIVLVFTSHVTCDFSFLTFISPFFESIKIEVTVVPHLLGLLGGLNEIMHVLSNAWHFSKCPINVNGFLFSF